MIMHLAKPEAQLAAGHAFAACLARQAGQHHSAHAGRVATKDLSSYRLALCCFPRISRARFHSSIWFVSTTTARGQTEYATEMQCPLQTTTACSKPTTHLAPTALSKTWLRLTK